MALPGHCLSHFFCANFFGVVFQRGRGNSSTNDRSISAPLRYARDPVPRDCRAPPLACPRQRHDIAASNPALNQRLDYLPLNDAEILVRAIEEDAQADDNGGAQ